MVETISVTERGSDWDKHDRAWADYDAKKATPEYKPAIFEKIKAERDAQWEVVGDRLDRFRVPGGWLYRTTRHVSGGLLGGGGHNVALAFVPEPMPPK